MVVAAWVRKEGGGGRWEMIRYDDLAERGGTMQGVLGAIPALGFLLGYESHAHLPERETCIASINVLFWETSELQVETGYIPSCTCV